MNPFQYQQQQQLQYPQQYGQQQVQFVPAYSYNIQAQANQPTAASSQYGGTFTSMTQQPVVGLYTNVAPDAQFGQTQANPQVYTPAFAGQTQMNPTYQTFAYQFQQQPATNLQSNDEVSKSSTTASSSTSFDPPPMNFPSMNVTDNSGGQLSLEDINQKYTEQYQKWQQQYNEWQAQHANHPDKKLFQEYQNQVQQWQQQMIQAQGMSLGMQSQAPQVTPNQTGQQTHNQLVQDASVNVSSQQTVTRNPNFPSMQYQSSSQFSNQSQPKATTFDNQNNKPNFTVSSKQEEGKSPYHWQQNQQHKQPGWLNPNTNIRSNQTSQASAGNPRPELKKENVQGGPSQWQQNQGKPRPELLKEKSVQGGPNQWQQNQQHKQPGWLNQNNNTRFNQTSQASAGKQRPELKKENIQGGPSQWQQNQQHQQPGWLNQNTNARFNQIPQASGGKPKPELKKENVQAGPSQWQQNQQHQQPGWLNQNTNARFNQTPQASAGKPRPELKKENVQGGPSQWQQNQGKPRPELLKEKSVQGGPNQWQQNQQHQQPGWLNQNTNARFNQTPQASGGKPKPELKKENVQAGPSQWQQNQQHQQPGWLNQNTIARFNQTPQAGAGKPRPELKKENVQGGPSQWQQNQGKPRPELLKENSVQSSLNRDMKASQLLPKWMQEEGNKSQQQNKTTEIQPSSTPKWLQGDAKIPVPEQESKKTLPKWLQNSNNDINVSEQQGFQENINKQQNKHQENVIRQQNKQVSEPVMEQVEQKSVAKDTKPLPKWLQDAKATTTHTSTKTESTQAQQTSLTTAMSTSSSFSGLLVQKLNPKQELELLQKQSIQLLQLAQLEKKHKESKAEVTDPIFQKPIKAEPKPDTSIIQPQPKPSDNLTSQRSSSNQQLMTHTSSEHPIQNLKQEGTSDQSTKDKSKDNIQKPQAPSSKLKSVPCRFFPKCRYGAECKFRHPPCTKGKSCTSKDCIFDHSDLPDEAPGNDSKVGSFGSLGTKDVQIPGIGDGSHHVEPAANTEERHQPILRESTLKDSTPVESKHYVPPKQEREEMGRYPEERRGGEPDSWRDDEWQRWRNERDRDYVNRDERLIPPRDDPPPHWNERERPYPHSREEWEKSERQRPMRENWERPLDWASERDREHPPRGEEYRWYEDERWKRRPDDWNYPPYREDSSRPPLSPRYRREPEYDRQRYPPREMRERPYYDRDFKNDPSYPRDYEDVDRYRRPLSPPPEEYDRRKEWEDREREYYWPQSREPDWRDRRDRPVADLQSDRYHEDYGRQRRGMSPPVDPSRPPMYDRPRYRDYPPDYDRKDGYWDRRDYDRGQDLRDDMHPAWRRNPDIHHEDVRYQDHHTTREPVKPVQPDKPKAVVVPVETILDKPGRDSRPDRIVIILRGLPGSGKTHVARLVKDKEAANGAHAPRIISLDDYFLTEVEKQEKDPDTGKRVKKKVTEYLFEAEMEDSYRASMFKSFSKTLEDGFFPVVMVDAINNKVEHFEKYWSFAKQKGFEVYIAELSADSHVCAKRNSHNRTYEEISKIQSDWEESPTHMLRLDVRSLLQDAVITEVEMETADTSTPSDPPKELVKSETNDDDAEVEEDEGFKSRILLPQTSKWDDVDSSAEAQLNKLDGIRPLKRRREESPPLPLSDDEDPYDEKEEDMRIGKKRVRWADIEERKHMEHRRRIGFCIGTDWSLLTDPNAKIPEH